MKANRPRNKTSVIPANSQGTDLSPVFSHLSKVARRFGWEGKKSRNLFLLLSPYQTLLPPPCASLVDDSGMNHYFLYSKHFHYILVAMLLWNLPSPNKWARTYILWLKCFRITTQLLSPTTASYGVENKRMAFMAFWRLEQKR